MKKIVSVILLITILTISTIPTSALAAKRVTLPRQASEETMQMVKDIVDDPENYFAIGAVHFPFHDGSTTYQRLASCDPKIKELEKRSDAGIAILATYINMPVSKKLTYDENMMLVLLEIFIRVDLYWNQLTDEEKDIMDMAVLNTETLRVDRGLGTAGFDVCYSGYPVKQSTSEKTNSRSAETENLDYISETLYTRDGQAVTGKQYIIDYSADTIATINQYIANRHPNAQLLAGATSMYDGHSYAWHLSSTSNTYSIDAEEVFKYIQDVHTVPTAGPEVSNVVVYFDADWRIVHSGIVTAVTPTTITVTSKWGHFGLYVHEINDVPNSYKADGQARCVYYDYRQHNYVSTPYSAVQHKITCSFCNDSYYGPHRWNGARTQCLSCGFTDDFPSIRPNALITTIPSLYMP